MFLQSWQCASHENMFLREKIKQNLYNDIYILTYKSRKWIAFSWYISPLYKKHILVHIRRKETENCLQIIFHEWQIDFGQRKKKKRFSLDLDFQESRDIFIGLKSSSVAFLFKFSPNAQTILPYQRCELIELRIENVEMFCTFLTTFYCMEYRPIKQRKTFLIIQCINKVLIELKLYPLWIETFFVNIVLYN